MPKVVFVSKDGTRQEVEAATGASVLSVARAGGVRLAGACMGALVCGGCRVEVDPAWKERVPPPETQEAAALEAAWDATPDSRLACALKVTEALDGLVVHLPG
ncbi:MAG: 2Fe-2S iron-sulfur cluster binding domain-containing protein [Holosporales bacterium]|jgi:2Fe-2S ferredoxin|nr:2Fe-2S iron-sulfur cluster binding domain-containing protein [Holosporales bacterium]